MVSRLCQRPEAGYHPVLQESFWPITEKPWFRLTRCGRYARLFDMLRNVIGDTSARQAVHHHHTWSD